MSNEWTNDELRILSEKYSELTAKELSAGLLAGRTPPAIYAKAVNLGISEKRPRKQAPWAPDELEILNRHAGTMTAREIHNEYLPKRTPKTIRNKVRQLGIRAGETPEKAIWTDGDVMFLRENFENMPVAEIAKRLDRTPEAVRARAVILKLNKKQPHRAATYVRSTWSDHEDAVLINHAGTLTTREIRDRFMPERTIGCVQHRIQTLGLTRKKRPDDWSDAECRILKKYAENHIGLAELAAMLPGRSEKAIAGKLLRLGIRKDKTKKGHCRSSPMNWE